MSVIAVISMKGGVGKTTITANLATAMAAALGEHRVSVVDLDPQNSLHLHLGVKDTDSPGVCRQALREASWREAMAHAHGVRCLPYGFVCEQERRDFEQLLRTHPHWLSEQIRTAGINADAVVLIDTPPGPSVYLQQVLDCADVVLMVVLPDAASYAVLPVMGAWLAAIAEQRPQVRPLYVINQVDRSELLNRDTYDLMNHQLQTYATTGVIHADEAVREALVFQEPVLAYAPHGQGSHDLSNLANTLIDILSQ